MSTKDLSTSRTDAPLLNNENAFKLAVFGVNVSSGCSMTSAEGTVEVDWAETKRIARAADAAGLDAMVPVARWKGPGGAINFNDRSFEAFTWAAAVAAVTERLQVLATIQVPTAHPLRIAKEAATVDHISGGRFGLNVVAGWNEPELAMFGIPQRPHDERYDVAAEWVSIIKRLWSEDTFDYEGTYFRGTALHSSPQPVQAPGPLIMSAGASGKGLAFAAEHADVNFIQAPDLAGHAQKAEVVRQSAREFGREIAVMGMGYVVCADTEKEAQDYFDYYVNQRGDWEGAANMMGVAAANIEAMDMSTRAAMTSMVAGYTAQPLIGTPEQIVDKILGLSRAGLDGCTLSWVDYDEGIAQYQEQILPLLVEAGLRAEVKNSTSQGDVRAAVGL
ncbi:LLM class flavin-dependent oxidoreductase [Rhodococcus sp. HM1]|uniref:LLM class flavin-dependent oxidoreductase n=1 Tax=Rhodococcus sp. HM1 TaxID=2937759 RepID=UPI00200AFEE7|nr:LLM class flavin-dependent oxidoreductase [Rhodococcus sp. HM1]MCK8671557.1 LLM class flavin-dependent oxidoreductase [Rhodococcus sp. HM1]